MEFSGKKLLTWQAFAFWTTRRHDSTCLLECEMRLKAQAISAHIRVCHPALHYLPTALHKGNWAKGPFNHGCKLTRHWMCTIQQQELKTLSKSCCSGDGLARLPRNNKSCSARAAGLLCIRKHDPSDLVAALEARQLPPITGCTGLAGRSLHPTWAASPFMEWGPSRHSVGEAPKYCRNSSMRKKCGAIVLASSKGTKEMPIGKFLF